MVKRRELTHQLEVAASADAIWGVYGSKDIPRLLRDVLLPGVFEKLDIIEGDGGVGTVLEIAFHPGAVPQKYMEKFVKVDHENRLKEVIMIGGYLDMGCTFYMDRIHVVAKGPNSCIIKSTLIYEVKEEYADAMASIITVEPLASMAQVVSSYVLKNQVGVLRSVQRRELTHDLEVAASANAVWGVYGSKDIPRLLRDVLLPGVFEKLDVIEGDGGVGTVLEIAFPPGAIPRTYKEKFVKVDHEQRLKEVIMIGGYLDMGCTFYMDRIHVVPKGLNSCIIKSTLIYEVKEEYADAMASLITVEPLASMAEVVANYVLHQQVRVLGSVKRKELTHELEVAAPADAVWGVYSSPDIPRLLRDVLLPGVFEKLDVIHGNGGVGTVLEIVFHPGAIPRRYKEKFVTINQEKRLKEVIMIGGYLDMGCTLYMDRIHVVEKGPNSCVIKSTLIYEVKAEYADAMASLITVDPLASMAQVISNYVLKNQGQVLGSIKRRELKHELEVAVSADAIWGVIGSKDIPRLLRDVLLPGVFEKLDVIEGDGGVGTVLEIVFPPGAIPRKYREKFVKVDHEKRLKEVIMIGGYLDMGCTFYMDRIHVVRKGLNSCIIKSTLIYEVKKEYADAMASLITIEPLASMAEVVSNYVLKNQGQVLGSVKRRELKHELDVAASADAIWGVYGSKDIPRLLRDVLLPGVFEKLDVIEGDGGVGTVLEIVFPPGAVPRKYREKFVKVDHEKRLKEVIMIGGFLDMGCTFYMDRIHVVAKGPNSCIIKSTLIYEVKEEYADAMASLITVEPLASMAEVVANYVLHQQVRVLGSVKRKELTHELEVAAPADAIWGVYSSPDIPRLLRDVLLPGVFEKLEVIQGNGGVGTVLEIVFHPGAIPRRYKEKFVTINHEKRLKEVIMIGGYLDMGCTLYMDRIHVVSKGPNSCVIKSTLIYEVKAESADAMASTITIDPLASMAQVISNYVLKNQMRVLGSVKRRELTHELEVAASADAIWGVYGSKDIPRLLRDVLLPGVFEKLEVIEGDGGVGTVLQIVFPPGAIPRRYKEKFVKVDQKLRLKEVIMIGGYLDMGCTFYMDRIHVVPKGLNSCVIKSTLIYEVKDEYADAMSSLITVEPLASMAEVVSNYVLNKKKLMITRKELTHELEVAASADAIWSVYSSPDIPRLLRDVLLPGVFEKLEVVQGNGGVGTVLEIVFPKGSVPRRYKEKFVKINDEKKLKEVIMIEGGYLDLGCTFYMDKIHVLPKGPNSCVIESSLIYEVKEENAKAMASLITVEPLASMAEVVANYVLKKQIRVLGYVVKPRVGYSVLVGLLLCLVLLGVLLLSGVNI